MINDFVIRRLGEMEDLERVTDLQVEVWGFDYRDAIPAHIMKSIGKGASTPLGAETGGQLVGFIYSFPTSDPQKQYIHMVGVHPDYRSQSIGKKLFKMQHEISKEHGIELAEWTYDPLEAANAKLYISRLGGKVEGEYQRDNYGSQKGMNRGIPSDRFVLKWRIGTERVENRLEGRDQSQDIEEILESVPWALESERVDGTQRCKEYESLSSEKVLVEIPQNFQEMKEKDFDEALKWRMTTGDLFEDYFSRGYVISEFFSVKSGEERKNFYLLEKNKA